MRVRYWIFQLFTMSACLIYQLCELVVVVMVVMLSVVFVGIFGSSRSRISPPGAGRQPLRLGQKPIIWQDFIKKTAWNERNWTEREGRSSLAPLPCQIFAQNMFLPLKQNSILPKWWERNFSRHLMLQRSYISLFSCRKRWTFGRTPPCCLCLPAKPWKFQWKY